MDLQSCRISVVCVSEMCGTPFTASDPDQRDDDPRLPDSPIRSLAIGGCTDNPIMHASMRYHTCWSIIYPLSRCNLALFLLLQLLFPANPFQLCRRLDCRRAGCLGSIYFLRRLVHLLVIIVMMLFRNVLLQCPLLRAGARA